MQPRPRLRRSGSHGGRAEQPPLLAAGELAGGKQRSVGPRRSHPQRGATLGGSVDEALDRLAHGRSSGPRAGRPSGRARRAATTAGPMLVHGSRRRVPGRGPGLERAMARRRDEGGPALGGGDEPLDRVAPGSDGVVAGDGRRSSRTRRRGRRNVVGRRGGAGRTDQQTALQPLPDAQLDLAQLRLAEVSRIAMSMRGSGRRSGLLRAPRAPADGGHHALPCFRVTTSS